MKKSPYEVGGEQVWWYKETLAPSASANAERLFLYKEGIYKANMETVAELPGDHGITVTALSKQQLEQEMTSGRIFAYGWNLDGTADRIKQAFPQTAYYAIHAEVVRYPSSSYWTELEKEYFKPFISADSLNKGIYSDGFNRLRPLGNSIGDGVRIYNDNNEYREAYDELVYVSLYDDDLQPIGYIVLPVEFDENTVADGYTPTGYWQPASQ